MVNWVADLGKLPRDERSMMSDLESRDLPFKDDNDEPQGVPVADPDAVAEADEDAAEDDVDDRTDVVTEDQNP